MPFEWHNRHMAKTAAIYCRISNDDKENDRPDAKGVTRQEREGRDYVKRRGYKLAGVYVDNDLGASRHSRNKDRPDWDRMVADIRSGRVQIVVARDHDRLTRKMREIEDIIDLYDETGIEFDLWRGYLDLSNASGQSMARWAGAQAAAESDKISERMKSQRRDAAHRGSPVRSTDGFGWKNGKHVAKEARAIQAAADMLITGATLESVARDWNRRGLKRRKTDRPWWGPQVRVVMLNPRHAGLAVYRGEVVGETGEKPIIDRATFETMKAVLTNPSRRRAPRRRNLLTGLVICGECGRPMRRAVSGTPARPMYRCQSANGGGCGRLSVMSEPVDQAVVEAVLEALEASELPRQPQRVDNVDAGELADIDSRLAELGERFADGDIPMSAFTAASKKLEERRRELMSSIPSTGTGFILQSITPKTIRKDWETIDADQRRLIIAALIERITVRSLRDTPVKRDPVARLTVEWKA